MVPNLIALSVFTPAHAHANSNSIVYNLRVGMPPTAIAIANLKLPATWVVNNLHRKLRLPIWSRRKLHGIGAEIYRTKASAGQDQII